jgi:cyclase
MGKPQDLMDVVLKGHADAVAMAEILHYRRTTIGDIRKAARDAGLLLRDHA